MVGSIEILVEDTLSVHGSSSQNGILRPEVVRSIAPIHISQDPLSPSTPNLDEVQVRGSMMTSPPQPIMDSMLYEHIKTHPPRENLLRASVPSPNSNPGSRPSSRPSSRPTTPTFSRGRTYSNTSSPTKDNKDTKLRSVSPDMSEITYASEALHKPRATRASTAISNHNNAGMTTPKKSPQRLNTRAIAHQDRPVTPVRTTTPLRRSAEDALGHTATPKQRKQMIINSTGGRDLTYGRNGSMLGPFNQMTKEMTYDQYTQFNQRDLATLQKQLLLSKLQLTSKVTCDRVENEALIKRMWLMVTKKEEEAYTISVREKTMEEFVKVHNRLMEIERGMEVILESVAPTFERLNQFNHMKQAQKDAHAQVKSIKQFNVRAKLNQDYAEKILNLEKAVKLLERMNEKRERLFRTKIKDEASRLNTSNSTAPAPLPRTMSKTNSAIIAAETVDTLKNGDASGKSATTTATASASASAAQNRPSTPPAVSAQDKRWIRTTSNQDEESTSSASSAQNSPVPTTEISKTSDSVKDAEIESPNTSQQSSPVFKSMASPDPSETEADAGEVPSSPVVVTTPSSSKKRKSAAEEYLLEQLGLATREKSLSRSNSTEHEQDNSPDKAPSLEPTPTTPTKEEEEQQQKVEVDDSSAPKRSAAEEYLLQQLGMFKSSKPAVETTGADVVPFSVAKSQSAENEFGGTQMMDDGFLSSNSQEGQMDHSGLPPDAADYKSIYDSNYIEDPNAIVLDDSPHRRASFGRQALHVIEEGDEDCDEETPPRPLPAMMSFGRASSGRGSGSGILLDYHDKSLLTEEKEVPGERRGSFGKLGDSGKNAEEFGLMSSPSTDSVDPTNGLDNMSDLTASIDMQDNQSTQSKASDLYSRASDHPPIAGMPPTKKKPRPTMKGLVKRVNSLLALGRSSNNLHEEESKGSEEEQQFTSPTKKTLEEQNAHEPATKDWDDFNHVEADNFSVSSAGESSHAENQSQASKTTDKKASKSLSFFSKASVSFFSKKKSNAELGSDVMSGTDPVVPEEKKEKKAKKTLSFFSKKKDSTDMSVPSEAQDDDKSAVTESSEKKVKKIKSVLSFFSKKKKSSAESSVPAVDASVSSNDQTTATDPREV